jgi:hypothetical protein
LILNQWEQTSPALQEFVRHHLERIQGNIRYAVAQDNNHGTRRLAEERFSRERLAGEFVRWIEEDWK